MKQYSAKAFQRKIDAFCQLRLTLLFGDDDLYRLTAYMHSLIQTRRPAPCTSGKTDWDVVAEACGVSVGLLETNSRQIEPAFDAIARWIRARRPTDKATGPEVHRTQ